MHMKYVLMKERKKGNLREKFSGAAIYAIFSVVWHIPGAVKQLLQ